LLRRGVLVIPLKVGDLVIAWLDDEHGKSLEALATRQPCSAGPALYHIMAIGPQQTYEVGCAGPFRYMESTEPVRVTIELEFLNASQWQEDARARR
jgi:hypothetical protein